MTSEQLARKFHETYEALAPQMGYVTRPETAVSWADLPETNRALMVAVCNAILEDQGDKDAIDLDKVFNLHPVRTERFSVVPSSRVSALEAENTRLHKELCDARILIEIGIRELPLVVVEKWPGLLQYIRKYGLPAPEVKL